MIDQNFVPPKRQGIAHFIASARYSAAGFRRLFAEAAFRQELAFLAVLTVVFAGTGVAPVGWAIGFVLFALLVAFEAVNTAIEEVVDRISPERSDFARNAKDLGSLAVACMIAANVLHAAYVVYAAL